MGLQDVHVPVVMPFCNSAGSWDSFGINPSNTCMHVESEPLAHLQVASWWDYGYQTTAMANRTVIVDNNTWNNTHIATVGRAMASPEHQAWQIYRDLDVKYVLVVFGGFVG